MTRRSLLRATAAAAVAGAATVLMPDRSGWAVGAPAHAGRKITDGVLQAFDADVKTVTLSTATDGSRIMTIEGFEPVRWLTGD